MELRINGQDKLLTDVAANAAAIATNTTNIGDLAYTENNYITDSEPLTESVDKLDMAVNDNAAQISQLGDDAVTRTFLHQSMRATKGGVIGTNGKGAIAIRTDDQMTQAVVDALYARNLPAGHALCSRFDDPTSAAYSMWGSAMVTAGSWDWIKTNCRKVYEIWNHGTTHSWMGGGDAESYAQIVTAKAEIEAHGLKVQGFMQPGLTAYNGQLPFGVNGFTTPNDYKTYAGKLIMNTYALSESYSSYAKKLIPSYTFHGGNHITLDTMTVAQAIAAIKQTAYYRRGLEIMFHPKYLDTAGNITTVQLGTILDAIVTEWVAGRIEVLTPSGLYFADPGSTNRVDLITDGDFEAQHLYDSNYSTVGGWTLGAGHTIETTGGYTGNNFLRTPNDGHQTSQQPYSLTEIGTGLNGEMFMYEARCRSTSGTATANMKITDPADETKLYVAKSKSIGTDWTYFAFPFSIPMGTTNYVVARLYCTAGTAVDWDDVHIRLI